MVHLNRDKVALCFPGQLQRVPEIRDVKGGGDFNLPHPFFKKAWETIGFSYQSFSFKEGERDNCVNLKLQVASYLLSMASFDRYSRSGGSLDIITEHSMGIYAALVAGGVFSFDDGLEILSGIGVILEEMGRENPGGMAVIIGLGRKELEKICQEVDNSLYIANLNASRHFVISGKAASIDKGMTSALKEGALSAQRLTFNTPLHSPLMEPIKIKIREYLTNFTINSPDTPIISHWGGKPLINRSEIREFLVEEVCKPVDWEGCVRSLLAQGVTCFIEVGPSDTLTKLIRWIDKDIKTVSLSQIPYEGGI